MILLAFHISHSSNTKGHAEKTYSSFNQNFHFPYAPIWIEVLCNACIAFQLIKSYPQQKQIAEKQNLNQRKVYTLTSENHSTQNDQYHPFRKETHV